MGFGVTNSFVALAKIVRTRGNRGEVLAELHTDSPDRFQTLTEVWVHFPDGRRERHGLEDAWVHQGRQVLRFQGVGSISDAEKFIGAWIEVAQGEEVALPAGIYFDHDLIGCTVEDPQGRHLGSVIDILRIEGNSQVIVRSGSGEFMIPAAAPLWQQISITHKQIVVDLPEGLIDLNE